MAGTNLYAFYGSLRRGMANYNIYRYGLKYIETRRVFGYELLTLGKYPYAVKSPHPSCSIVVEIFEVENENVRKAIHQMEGEAGYVLVPIEVDGKRVGIYLFERAGNELRVNGGDWVKFFGTGGK
ncbi:MAG TPA: gamma-glutamylcyclotransferase [Cyclobacteriaceae bacterium]|nr:gamma-glutamylcyclotransferase [Cyclobacteriaceae bacterium]MCB9238717.1 gamma-glutamylcyclotransferase [Flammeovirgaceae bacterium]MCB0497993.1 gamma-glutamylcyclotransferase [Cyclobacteriaceae bacterium]MCO5270435.1 gamma-glutamylcyclotransferase [Cyclobacteriaceae bacterium]MCW5901123.1 gamma-glutamylcyclotransferase [Cyclobacteriaceae bacterium]